MASNYPPLHPTLKIRKETLDWLLEPDNPSVRYFTLISLLGYPENDPTVLEAKKQIMAVGAVPRILSRQNPAGYWGKPDDFYMRSKYKGTVWNLILLSELGADGRDERIQKACQFVLEQVQDHLHGGFVYRHGINHQPEPNCVIPCLTGNMLFSLIRLGYLDDARVQQGIEWLTTYLRFDDGEQPLPESFPYSHLTKCFNRHSCHHGVIKGLKAFAEIAQPCRSPAVQLTIQRAIEYILLHQIFKKSHNLEEIAMPAWLKLGFPRMWDSDILEVLGILVDLGCRDSRMQPAVDQLLSKMVASEGRWILEDTWNSRMLVRIEQAGKPGKWVTLKSLKVLRSF